MVTLNKYITEKLHLNKDIKVKNDKVSPSKFLKALKNFGELYLEDVLDHDVEEGHGYKVLSIYMQGSGLYASFNTGKDYDEEIEIYTPDNLFNEDEMQQIYDYITNDN